MALRHPPVVLQGNIIVERPCIQVGTIHFFFLGVFLMMMCVVDPAINPCIHPSVHQYIEGYRTIYRIVYRTVNRIVCPPLRCAVCNES